MARPSTLNHSSEPAAPLGIMRYRCVAAPALITAWGGALPHRLLRSPVVIFNRKDALQDAWLAQHFNLQGAHYPRHFVPAVDAFELALALGLGLGLGLGWGMVPDMLLAARPAGLPLQEVLPGHPVDVVLYWQHWARPRSG